MKEKTAVVESLIAGRKKISGSCVPPPDKSITHRAVFFAALSPRSSRIKNPLLSGDCLSTIRCFQKLGVPIKIKKNEVRISAGAKNAAGFRAFKKPDSDLDCGNSGTTMRLISGVLSAQPFRSRLIGDASLSKRPMKRVIEPLRKMGAMIDARGGNVAPLMIQGRTPLKAIAWRSPVASAQVKSSILLAGLFADGLTTVREPAKSRDHSERMLKSLGAKISFDEKKNFGSNTVLIFGGAKLKGLNITVPGDFSSAAFFIAAALIVPGSELILRQVNLNPTRIGFLNVLKRMGAVVSVENLRRIANEPVGDIRVQYSLLKGVTVLESEVPSIIDEIPILAVVATQAKGETVISGAEELRVKESDRLAAIVSELKKMGARIKEKKDGLIIDGPSVLNGSRVRSFDDHRMAMSLAVAALVAKGRTVIKGFDCVRISFPGFLSQLKKLIR